MHILLDSNSNDITKYARPIIRQERTDSGAFIVSWKHNEERTPLCRGMTGEGTQKRKSIAAGLARWRPIARSAGASGSDPRWWWYSLNERENAFFGMEFNYPACELSTHFPAHYDLIDIYVYIWFAVPHLFLALSSSRPLDLRSVLFLPLLFKSFSSLSRRRIGEDLGRAFSQLLSRVLAVRSLMASANSAGAQRRRNDFGAA